MAEECGAFAEAVREYRWLLDRGYSAQASLKLVGDRRQLPRDERMILFRGIAPGRESESRRLAMTLTARGLPLLLDGYNQILTLMHYLEGKPVFVSSDGLVRDAGGSHGRIPDAGRFLRAMDELAELLESEAPSEVLAVFDAPVPRSAEHARLVLERLSSRGLVAATRIEHSADPPLKAAGPGTVVSTSDSAIVDAIAARGEAKVFDAAGAAIARLRRSSSGDFRPIPDLGALLLEVRGDMPPRTRA
jgi:hypothetical protein